MLSYGRKVFAVRSALRTCDYCFVVPLQCRKDPGAGGMEVLADFDTGMSGSRRAEPDHGTVRQRSPLHPATGGHQRFQAADDMASTIYNLPGVPRVSASEADCVGREPEYEKATVQ